MTAELRTDVHTGAQTYIVGSRQARPNLPQSSCPFWSLGTAGARRVVDLWAERTAALGERADISYVLVFENRGAEVGATIPHPHGQMYAFDSVPPQPLRELGSGLFFDPVPPEEAAHSLRDAVPERP